jgi:hypothetical protein
MEDDPIEKNISPRAPVQRGFLRCRRGSTNGLSARSHNAQVSIKLLYL